MMILLAILFAFAVCWWMGWFMFWAERRQPKSTERIPVDRMAGMVACIQKQLEDAARSRSY